MLRQEFSLSIEKAKEIMVKQETGQSLHDYPGALLDPLIQAFADSNHTAPKFELGDQVETVGDQHTFKVGIIRERIWHHKDRE
ncbi:MAG: hypothetical protein ACYC67_21865 [Prosthecobacter sp.]